MLKVFDEMKKVKCHAITFLPSEEPEEQAIIQGLHYKEEGEIIKTQSDVGDLYDIIIFRGDVKDGYTDLEKFEAVLSCPYTYSNRMYHGDYFGFVAKKTTTSNEVVESLLEKIGDLVYGGSDERNLEQNSFKANT
jgi:hypothetical protein